QGYWCTSPDKPGQDGIISGSRTVLQPLFCLLPVLYVLFCISNGRTRRVFSSSDMQYSTNHTHVGKCVVMNNQCFSGLLERHGTEEDEKVLRDTFEGLGFTLQVERNLTARDMLRVLESVSREDHSERSCFVCVVLSHGDEGHILGTDGKAVPVGKLSATLTARRCPSLWGKPKLFFVQACRGQEYDCGVQTDSVVEREPCVTFCEAPEEDFLCGYSTPPGYFSWRNQATGSVYIRGLCLMLEQHSSLEMTRILTRVNQWVALNFESQTGHQSSSGKKQMPCVVSRLTKELYLRHRPRFERGSVPTSNNLE
uniref:Caspase-3 n=1 Tax=Scleropages formosus TaxID=113540 RepID=A0A8C9SFF0_SCLFO